MLLINELNNELQGGIYLMCDKYAVGRFHGRLKIWESQLRKNHNGTQRFSTLYDQHDVCMGIQTAIVRDLKQEFQIYDCTTFLPCTTIKMNELRNESIYLLRFNPGPDLIHAYNMHLYQAPGS